MCGGRGTVTGTGAGRRRGVASRNAKPAPNTQEARLVGASAGARLPRVDGAHVWRTRVPANGVATLTFTRPSASADD